MVDMITFILVALVLWIPAAAGAGIAIGRAIKLRDRRG